MVFTNADIADSRREWGFSLLGTVLGTNPSLQCIETYVVKLWAGHVPASVAMFSTGIFKFRFFLEEDLDWVLKGAPWMMVDNKPIMLRR